MPYTDPEAKPEVSLLDWLIVGTRERRGMAQTMTAVVVGETVSAGLLHVRLVRAENRRLLRDLPP